MYCHPPRDDGSCEPDADPFEECHSLRLRLADSFPSSEWPDILERYGSMVDCRDRVDNFSAATLALVSGQETDRSQWHTALTEPSPASWLADLGIQPCVAEQFTSARIRAMIPLTAQPENVTRDSFAARKQGDFASRAPSEAGFDAKRPEPVVQSRGLPSERERHQPVVQSRGLPSEIERQELPRNAGRAATDCRDHSEPEAAEPKSMFLTARDELRKQRQLRGGPQPSEPSRKCLGPRRKAGFVPPFVKDVVAGDRDDRAVKRGRPSEESLEEPVDERLAHVDPKMVELIRGEIMDECRGKITWDDVAGLEYAKATIQEMVVWPLLRPDLFTGLRSPPRGLLLFGPPGTGKTLLGRCIAAHAQATFFSVSAATLTSKWVGDGEKMVRALFAVARCHQPAVVFIDEIDSMLTQRSDTEHESSRRLKTEFLVQLDGAGVSGAERVLVVGATNRPQELDEAARRRLVKRLYIPLPDQPARRQLVARLLSGEKHSLSDCDLDAIATQTHGFSGADLRAACAEAALGPVRQLGADMRLASAEQVRPVSVDDFKVALTRVKPSVAPGDLDAYLAWDKTFGCGS